MFATMNDGLDGWSLLVVSIVGEQNLEVLYSGWEMAVRDK